MNFASWNTRGLNPTLSLHFGYGALSHHMDSGQFSYHCGVSKDLHSWDDEVTWLIGKFRGKFFSNTVRKLAWSATVYYRCQERNCRVFRGIQRPPPSLLEKICFEVHTRSSPIDYGKLNPHNSMIRKPLANHL